MTTIEGKLTRAPHDTEKVCYSTLEREDGSKLELVAFAKQGEAKRALASLATDALIRAEGFLKSDNYRGVETQQFVLRAVTTINTNTESAVGASGGGWAGPANYNDGITLEELLEPVTSVTGYKPEVLLRRFDVFIAPQGSQAWLQVLHDLRAQLSPEEFARRVAASILLPELERMEVRNPTSFPFAVQSFRSYGREDWLSRLRDLAEEEARMDQARGQLVRLGAIRPIEFAPYSRQAHRWLCEAATDHGLDVNETYAPYDVPLKDHFLIPVTAFGGISISNLFDKHEHKLKDLYSWATAFFFERVLHNTYSLDQLRAMKMQELEKINPRYLAEVIN